MEKFICFVAGKSGGHIIPAIYQAKKEIEKDPDYNILFFSTDSELDKKIIKNYPFIDFHICLPVGNVRPSRFINFFWKYTKSFFKSLWLLRRYKPEKIISMGGISSIPVCLAGKFLSIPVELYELNVEPGKAINFMSKFSTNINVCFEETKNYFPKKECLLVPYPVRFNQEDKEIDKCNAIKKIGLFVNRKTIFIVGGSQGSLFLNNLIKKTIINMNLQKIQVIHQTGSHDNFDWQNFYTSHGIPAITFDFNNDVKYFLAASDLVICRSGAGTLAELLFFNKKNITIPLETKSTSHQILNARAMERKYPDLFHVIKQKEIEDNSKLFFSQVNRILN